MNFRETFLPRARSAAAWFWREWLKPILVILLVTGTLRSALADWNDVPTGSMKPTILEGDRIWVNKLAYDLKVPFTTWHLAEWNAPRRGEIIVFYSPHDGVRLVKRCIGVPGDVIELRDNKLFINSEAVAYQPLAPELAAAIPAEQQPRHQFAEELLPGRAHSVMATPAAGALRTFGPTTVPAGSYFVMGDNRDNSFDSRYFGCVERRRILGRATAVAISFDREHHWSPRWKRFFTALR